MFKPFSFSSLLVISALASAASAAPATEPVPEPSLQDVRAALRTLRPEVTDEIKWFNGLPPQEQLATMNEMVALDVGMLRLMKAFAEFNRQMAQDKYAKKDLVARQPELERPSYQEKHFDLSN